MNATGVVHFWARQATDGPAKALTAQFNATHKNLKVVLHLTPPNDDTSQLATAIRAGSVPDVVGLNDIDVPAFAREHALLNITKYVNALPYKNQLSPGHLKLATIGNQYYGVPYLADLSVLWYNKALFKRAGLNPNAPPTSYAQIVSDARKISALGQTQNGLNWGKDFEAGKVGILPGDYGFAAAMTSKQDKADFADAPLPAVNGGSYSTFDGGDNFVIPAGAPNPSGAWEFVKWALEPQQQAEYPTLGDTPVRSDVLTPAFAAKFPYDAVALKALAKGSVEYTLAYDAVFNEPGSPWFKMFEDAVYNGNVGAGLQEGQSGIQSTLDTVKG